MFQAGAAMRTPPLPAYVFASCPPELGWTRVSKVYWWWTVASPAVPSRAQPPVSQVPSFKIRFLFFVISAQVKYAFFLSLKHLKHPFYFCPTKKKNYFQFYVHFWCDGVLLVIHEMGKKNWISEMFCF